MKKLNVKLIISLVAFSLASSSHAATLYLDFKCSPTVGDLPYVIVNNGLTISGLAKAYLNGKRVKDVLFSGITPTGTPTILSSGGYHRSDTDYDVLKGIVYCHYQSAGSNPQFTVQYILDKGAAGQIVYKTPESIRIRMEIG